MPKDDRSSKQDAEKHNSVPGLIWGDTPTSGKRKGA